MRLLDLSSSGFRAGNSDCTKFRVWEPYSFPRSGYRLNVPSPLQQFFQLLGQALGAVIRFIVEGLGDFFGLFARAGHNFLEGLSRTLGMDRSLLSLVALVIGLLLLVAAVRSFFRGSIIGGLVWLFLGLWLLSWLIH